MGPIRGRQDPGGPHVGLVNLVIWDCLLVSYIFDDIFCQFVDAVYVKHNDNSFDILQPITTYYTPDCLYYRGRSIDIKHIYAKCKMWLTNESICILWQKYWPRYNFYDRLGRTICQQFDFSDMSQISAIWIIINPSYLLINAAQTNMLALNMFNEAPMTQIKK